MILGVFGGGQLGRMFALAAKQMGYGVAVFTPEKDSPASQVADKTFIADYTDKEVVEAFARSVSAVTVEFENIPSETLRWAEAFVPVRPGPHVLATTQHRIREKTFLKSISIPTTPFAVKPDELATIGVPFVFKTAGFGYDGKGQKKISNAIEQKDWLTEHAKQEWIAEKFVDFEKEFSVIGVRGHDGQVVLYEPIENRHSNHILDVSFSPAVLSDTAKQTAQRYVRSILEKLEVVGVLCVEFFLTKKGEVLVNELAPRPHNSGHLTIEACITSQFEQQVRATAGIALGETTFKSPASMANLLGDVWSAGEPKWEKVKALPETYLHLYGKSSAKPGRKMGHLTVVAQTADVAVEKVTAARAALTSR